MATAPHPATAAPDGADLALAPLARSPVAHLTRLAAAPASLRGDAIQHLQQSVGNHAVQRILDRVLDRALAVTTIEDDAATGPEPPRAL